MSEGRTVEHSVVVATTPELAFEALTKASELREWFGDEAWTEVRPGGRYEVRWSGGYRAEGKFGQVDPPRQAAVTWRGSGEPGQTAVEFIVEPAAGGVTVTVIHSGLGLGADWNGAAEQAEKGWATGLENLKSVLETGIDLRLTRQPFLGIYLAPLTPERAAKEGIAAEYGIYLEGTAEGSGAAAAGLGKGDVIVGLGGIPTPGYDELGVALRACRAGDTVAVDLVRGQKQETVTVTLGQRPQPEVPATLADLVERLAARHAEVNAELEAALEGVADVEAGMKPAEGEWSVKQVLAHLSDGERGLHVWLPVVAVNGWDDADGVYPDQYPGRMEAVMAVAPTVGELLDRFLTDEAETVALLRGLPGETVAHRARFRRIAQNLIGAPDHTAEHTGQIRRAIEAVRSR